MRLIGFSFLKIHAEKLSSKLSADTKVNTNINIVDIQEVKSEVFNSKESLLSVKFDYNISYDPDYASVSFSGMVLISLLTKEAKDISKQWKESKFPEEFKLFLFNVILKRSNLKALQLEEELNLPSHIPLPSLKIPSKDIPKK